MAYVHQTPSLGLPPITDTRTKAAVAIGTISRAVDPTYGSGEFIYLQGVVGTVAGLVVGYDNVTGLTYLASTSGVVDGGSPLAVAMSANVALGYGWYQITGNAVVLKTAVKVDPASSFKVYLSATAGRVLVASTGGRQIVGARYSTAATVTTTTSTCIISLNRPTQKTGTLV
jgi:predicted anti-sigma-YlaC factor YlaD